MLALLLIFVLYTVIICNVFILYILSLYILIHIVNVSWLKRVFLDVWLASPLNQGTDVSSTFKTIEEGPTRLFSYDDGLAVLE